MLCLYLRKASEPGIHRLVSLISAVEMSLERIIWDMIYQHLEMQGLINDSELGFVWRKSCQTNLIEPFVG